MTDVLDRVDAADLPPFVDAPGSRPDDARPRAAIAALSAAAAAIHLAMVPSHFAEWTLEGAGFLASAWAQLAVAYVAVTRPSKRLWWFAIASNAAFVAAWIVSRTSGFPFGPHEGIAEDMTIVDGLTVLFELAVVFGALAMLLLPLQLRSSRSRLFAPVLPLVVLALTTGVLASPSARNHSHGADGHAHAALTPAIAAIQDRGFGTFMNGHDHGRVEVVLDPATQTELDRELAITAQVAKEFPTVQAAMDAGYKHAGPYVPGIGFHMINFSGEHYLNPDGVMDDEDLRHPLGLMYLGAEPDSELGGFMYYAATKVEPEGFPGRNDGWHFHENLCAVPSSDGFYDFPFGPDFGATQAQCDGVGGELIDSNWMVHVWTVPGWDDMKDYGGVFAEMHPGFGCSDGTWFSLPFERWGENSLNTCRTGVAAQPEL
jgi:hypothetical protein